MAAPGAVVLSTLTGTETVPVDAGGAVVAVATSQAIASLWSGTVQADGSFTTVNVTSGQTVTLSGTRSTTALSLTQTAAAATVQLPAAPVNGQIARFSTNQNITALTLTASTTSQTIAGAPSTASTASAGVFGWMYDLSNTTWYRYA